MRTWSTRLGPSRNVLGPSNGRAQMLWGQQLMLWCPTETSWGQATGNNKCFGLTCHALGPNRNVLRQAKDGNKCYGVSKPCCGAQQKHSGVKQQAGTNVLGANMSCFWCQTETFWDQTKDGGMLWGQHDMLWWPNRNILGSNNGQGQMF